MDILLWVTLALLSPFVAHGKLYTVTQGSNIGRYIPTADGVPHLVIHEGEAEEGGPPPIGTATYNDNTMKDGSVTNVILSS